MCCVAGEVAHAGVPSAQCHVSVRRDARGLTDRARPPGPRLGPRPAAPARRRPAPPAAARGAAPGDASGPDTRYHITTPFSLLFFNDKKIRAHPTTSYGAFRTQTLGQRHVNRTGDEPTSRVKYAIADRMRSLPAGSPPRSQSARAGPDAPPTPIRPDTHTNCIPVHVRAACDAS